MLWFDLLLKGEQNDFKEKTPRVQYYTMGSNKWQASELGHQKILS